MAERQVAVITGASMGIGEAFADALAERGYDLALIARHSDALTSVAARIAGRSGCRVEPMAADLTDAVAVDRVAVDVITAFGRVDLLVNNAGYGAHGGFETIGSARHAGQIRLNVEALVALTDRFAPAMLARGSGGIINVASTAAFQPVPYMAVYGATKAFVLSFSEALSEEFRSRGVRVLALCPGPTSTNFFKIAGEGAQMGSFRSVQQVVKTALRAYDRGDSYVVDGPVNRVMAVSQRFMPRTLVARVAGRLMMPKPGAAGR